MRVGFLQFKPQFGTKDKNFRTVEHMLNRVVADLIVLPELFATGYSFLNKKELKKFAEPGHDGETARFMVSLAGDHNCYFAYGFPEIEGNHIYNSAALASPAGIVGIYRKTHLFFEEKRMFAPGNLGFPVYKVHDTTIGMVVCYDWIYPETIRTLAMKGAQVILHAANLVMPYCPDAHITRALENRVFIVMANRIGEERRGKNTFTFIGKSEIVSPHGKVIARARPHECLVVREIDPRVALNKQVNKYNSIFEDRRADIYFK